MDNSKQLNNAERRMINGIVQILTREGIKVVGATIDGGIGDTSALATETTQLLTAKEATLKLSTWTSIAGNSKEFTYYTGVEAGNPSGTANIKTVTYKTGATTVVTQTYAWDATDNVITITAS